MTSLVFCPSKRAESRGSTFFDRLDVWVAIECGQFWNRFAATGPSGARSARSWARASARGVREGEPSDQDPEYGCFVTGRNDFAHRVAVRWGT